MKKIRMRFPQIVVEEKVVDVSPEDYERLMHIAGDEEQASFIWSQMTRLEQEHTHGENFVLGYIEMDGFGLYITSEDCEKHEFVEEYYGNRCKHCDLFHAHGHGPWMPDPEPDTDDVCGNCGHDTSDFSDVGCAQCTPYLFED